MIKARQAKSCSPDGKVPEGQCIIIKTPSNHGVEFHKKEVLIRLIEEYYKTNKKCPEEFNIIHFFPDKLGQRWMSNRGQFYLSDCLIEPH